MAGIGLNFDVPIKEGHDGKQKLAVGGINTTIEVMKAIHTLQVTQKKMIADELAKTVDERGIKGGVREKPSDVTVTAEILKNSG